MRLATSKAMTMMEHNQLTKSQQEVHVDLFSKGCTALFEREKERGFVYVRPFVQSILM